MSNDNKAWFERDELPKWVADKDGEAWNLYKESDGVATLWLYRKRDKCPANFDAPSLEKQYDPCTPLVAENEQAKPLPSDALTILAGELKRALELRMGEHAKRIIDNYNYHPEDAVKAGNMAQLALAVNPNTSTTWALTPVKRYATDE